MCVRLCGVVAERHAASQRPAQVVLRSVPHPFPVCVLCGVLLVRVQAQATGKGPLADLADHLSNPGANNWVSHTSALSRLGCWVLGRLPVVVGLQPKLTDARCAHAGV